MTDSSPATHLMVLIDSGGRILAGIPVYDGYLGPVPVASEGQELARFELPEAEHGRAASEIDTFKLCTSLQVDMRRRVLTPIPSSAN